MKIWKLYYKQFEVRTYSNTVILKNNKIQI